MFKTFWIGVVLCGSFFFSSTVAVAQQGGHIGPSNGEIAGIVVGAGAAIGLVIYLAIPKEKTVEGCLDSSDSGMRLTDNRDGHVYSVLSDQVTLQPHHKVTVRGKKRKANFTVKKLLKDEGTC